MSNNQGLQNKVRTMQPSGNEARDFQKGCIAIQAAIKHAVAERAAKAQANVSWSPPPPGASLLHKMTFTASLNGKHETLEATKEQVLDSYERVDDANLSHAIRGIAHRLTA
jgi:hypothetical protein